MKIRTIAGSVVFLNYDLNELYQEILTNYQLYHTVIVCFSKSMKWIFPFILIILLFLLIVIDRKGYLGISNGQGQLLSRMCGPKNSMTFVSIGSAKIHLDLISWYPRRSFGLTLSYLIFTNGIQNGKKLLHINFSNICSSAVTAMICLIFLQIRNYRHVYYILYVVNIEQKH